MGRPWEILRHAVPATLTSNVTRNVDVYTKQGGGGTYTSLLGLSPDHNIGISILTAGNDSQAVFDTIKQAFLDIWLTAAEQAARDQAQANYEGTYTHADNSSIVVTLYPEEPALFVNQVISNGTDVLAFIISNTGALRGKSGKPGLWLYPMGVADGSKRIAFRGWPGLQGEKPAETCGSWAESDRMRWGNHPADLYIFELGEGGKAMGLEAPGLGKRLSRVRTL